MIISGIYKIQSIKKPKRIYIGSGVDIAQRWNEHFSMLNRNKHHSRKLQNHYNKYGKNDLVFSVLICCDKKNLIANEQFFLDAYDPWFNNCKKAGNTLGTKRTEEQLKKVSLALKGRKTSEETRKKLSKSLIGNKRCLGRIPWNKGIPWSNEIKQKIGEATKGRIPWNKGLKYTFLELREN